MERVNKSRVICLCFDPDINKEEYSEAIHTLDDAGFIVTPIACENLFKPEVELDGEKYYGMKEIRKALFDLQNP